MKNLKTFIITPVKEKKSEKAPDFNIQSKDEFGNVLYIGKAWKKSNQYGTFLSCQMAEANSYQGKHYPGYSIIQEPMTPPTPPTDIPTQDFDQFMELNNPLVDYKSDPNPEEIPW